MTLSQTAYYQSRGLHPDFLADRDADSFHRFFAIRENLYRNLLHIPPGLLDGCEALEVGCGTGESALYLALNGAKVTLMDPDPSAAKRVEETFARFDLGKYLQEHHVAGIEDFQTDRHFHFVTAEGFLFTLANRDAMLKKLCSLIRPGGIGTVSFPDRFGSFFEFLKKAALWRAYQLAGIEDVFGDDALSLAERLLGPAYGALPNARPFNVWWEDCMISPFLTWDYCWDYQEILSLIDGQACAFYSSAPRIYEPDARAWYKQSEPRDELRERILASYRSRRFDLLFGCDAGIQDGTEDAAVLAAAFEEILKAWSQWFGDLNRPMPEIDFTPAAKRLAGGTVPPEKVDELSRFFELLGSASLQGLIDGYAGLDSVSGHWGHSLQFLCFAKQGGE